MMLDAFPRSPERGLIEAEGAIGSNHKARRVQARVWDAERGDHPFSAALGGTKIDEQNLILLEMDHFSELGPDPY